MGRVTVDLNGKTYMLGCDDGREAHLQTLAGRIDQKLRQIAPDAGHPGEARLILMAALLIADDLLAV
jgi:cell division protein ZapA